MAATGRAGSDKAATAGPDRPGSRAKERGARVVSVEVTEPTTDHAFILSTVWEARSVALRGLIAGLCVAAATAIAALVTGEFDDTHWRVIATSLGFSLFSAFGASGDALRRQTADWRVTLGKATAGAALTGFVLLVLAVWFGDDSETLWRAFGVAGLLALSGSHASLVLRAHRRDDTGLVSALVWTSIVTSVFDTVVGDVAIIGTVDDVSDGFVRLVAVVLVIMVLSTVLAPLARKVAGTPVRVETDAFGGRPAALTLAGLADEVAAAASRLDAARTAADAHREAAALRELAARARR